jgi:hypothetical protein
MTEWSKNNLDGCGRCLIQLLSRNLPGRAEENSRNVSQDGRILGRDSDGVPIEYELGALPLRQPALQ